MDIYKNLVIIGAHFGGYSIWDEASHKLHGYENFYVDTSSSLFAMSPDMAKKIIFMYGVEKVMFGTDYPMWNPSEEIEKFMKVPLTDSERQTILWDNAAKLIGLK